MIRKTIRKLVKLMAVAGFMAMAFSANALIIDLGIWEVPKGGESASDELAFLNSTVLPAYNGEYSLDLPDATFGTENKDTGELLTITLDLTGWSYVKLKWGHNWQFYSIEGETGEHVFSSTGLNKNEKEQALSHYTFFSPRQPPPQVPDGGSTLMLMGLALSGFAVLKRWFAK